jgi:integrase
VARSIKIPSYRLHKPTNQAIVVLRGRTFYLGRFGSIESHDEYNRIISEWLPANPAAQRPQLTLRAQSDLRVCELILAYFSHVESYYVKDDKPTSQVHIVRQAIKPVRAIYGHTPAKEFGPLALKACRAKMIASGLSRTTINSLVTRIRQMFRWGVEQELIPASVHQALTAVPGLKKGRTSAREHPPVAPVPEARVEKTLKFLHPTLAAMVRFQELTGARPGEVISIRTCDLNTSGRIWEFVPASHKSEHHGQQRVVFIGPKAQALLKPWLKPEQEAFLFSPAEAESARKAALRAKRKSPLWPSHAAFQAEKRTPCPRRSPSDRYSVASYRRAIARACDLAFPHPVLSKIAPEDLTDVQRAELQAWRKVNRWHPHRLRHSAGTRIRLRFGLEAAQAVLGHSKLGTTQVYAERNFDAARDVMQAIG